MSATPHEEPPPLARLPTGIPGLDAVLGGGLLRGGLYLVEGAPGTGKTILANQLCFAHVAAGGRALYLTVLAESHARLLAHLRSLAFFDPAPLGEALYYLSGLPTLEGEGLRGLLELARQAARERRATLLVLDGLAAAAELAPAPHDLRRFAQQLQLSLEAAGGTAVLLATPEGGPRGDAVRTAADGVLALHDERLGPDTERQLEVRKLRGSGHLRGRHSFAIGAAGLAVYPRTEALHGTSGDAGERPGLVPFGIAQLDAMLGGGVQGGSATLLLGSSGSGKTLLGLHFLAAGLAAGEPGLHLGFYEPPPRLVAKAARLGLALGEARARGRLEFLWQRPTEQLLDALAERLLAAVARRGARRVVLDGLDGLRHAAARYPDRFPDFLAALLAELRARGATALATLHLPELAGPALAVPIDGVAELVENIVLLRTVEQRSQLRRLVAVVKAREGAHDRAIRELVIGGRGIEVAEGFGSAEATLTGVARPPAAGASAAEPRGGPHADDPGGGG